jgi:TorA maturation chaperone TorD
MDETGKTTLIEVMRNRENVYNMLASLFFKELSEEQIRRIVAQDYQNLSAMNDQIVEGIVDIKAALHRIHSGTREDLAVDYAHTFLAAGSTRNEKRASPYESLYTSDQGLLYQEAQADVYKIMHREHLEPKVRLHTPEDHVSFECEFMAQLSVRTGKALADKDVTEARRLLDRQTSFLSEHLLNWADDFLASVLACCRTRFYAGVTKVYVGYVRLDRDVLRDCIQMLSVGKQG